MTEKSFLLNIINANDSKNFCVAYLDSIYVIETDNATIHLIDEAYITIVDDIYYSSDTFINLFNISKNLKHRELIKVIKFERYYKEKEAHIYKFTK